MSADAVAVLPLIRGLKGKTVEGDWITGAGPAGGTGLWRKLNDGLLLNLALPIQTPDAELYEVAKRWKGELPRQIWVFPDVAVPEAETAKAIVEITGPVGRWVREGHTRKILLESFGFKPEEERAWQREMNSGNPKRIRAAMAELERRLKERDPTETEALLARFLGGH